MAISLALLTPAAHGQIQVGTELPRSTYMLYERLDLIVTLTNIGGNDLVLDNDGNEPWLSFIVTRKNGLPVPVEGKASYAPLTLKVGETKRLSVNITPLFSFRQEGEYRATAIVDLPGQGQIMSQPTPFTIEEGSKLWTQTHPFEGEQRVYTLFRFQTQLDHAALYLRVEDPQANIVYTNISLGELASFIDPQTYFDPDGNLHILQPVSLATYLYTRTNPSGKVIHQGIFHSAQEVPPILVKLDDGKVTVQGGVSDDTGPRERLSDAQNSSTSAENNATPPTGDIPR